VRPFPWSIIGSRAEAAGADDDIASPRAAQLEQLFSIVANFEDGGL
jgi:hypothetical protein